MTDIDIEPLEQSRDIILKDVSVIPIKDIISETRAVSELVKVADEEKRILVFIKSHTDPLEKEKKFWFSVRDHLLDPIIPIKSQLIQNLSNYRIGVEQARLKEESKLQSREDKKFNKAVESGKPPLVPEPLQVHLEAQPKTVQAESGKSVTYTEMWKADWEHIDFEKIPKAFNGVPILIVDRVAVNRLINAGIREIPGIPILKEIGTRVR